MDSEKCVALLEKERLHLLEIYQAFFNKMHLAEYHAQASHKHKSAYLHKIDLIEFALKNPFDQDVFQELKQEYLAYLNSVSETYLKGLTKSR